MKILKITGSYPPSFNQGGTVTAAHQFCLELKKQGHDVVVLTTTINGTEKLNGNRTFHDVYEGVDVYYFRANKKALPYYSYELSKYLKSIVNNFDLVLLDTSFTFYGLSVSRILRKNKIPYFVYSHGCYQKNRWKKSKIKKIVWWNLFDKKIYNSASEVIALTSDEKQTLLQLGVKSSIAIIPNGINVEHICDRNIENKNKRILFLGRINHIKGVDILIESLSFLKKRTDDFVLDIVGPIDENYKNRLITIAKDCDVISKIKFHGPVDNVGKWSFYCNTDIFCLTSRGEGFSMAILEALSVGKPVLISTHCSFPEVQGNRLGIIVDLNPQEIATGLYEILTKEPHDSSRSQLSMDFIRKNYSWKNIVKKTVMLWSEKNGK